MNKFRNGTWATLPVDPDDAALAREQHHGSSLFPGHVPSEHAARAMVEFLPPPLPATFFGSAPDPVGIDAAHECTVIISDQAA